MSKVGTNVTYTPTKEEQPMAPEKPQAAIITAWDEETEKASLAVFPEGQSYFLAKAGAVEGTTPGTFQQLATNGGASTKPAATEQKAQKAQTSSSTSTSTHKETQY